MPNPDLGAIAKDIIVGPLSDPALDDQVEHPDEGRDAPLDLDAIKAAITQRANDAAHRLDVLRRERAEFNREVKLDRATLEAEIRKAVTELAEAKRIANALKPRTRTKKAPAK